MSAPAEASAPAPLPAQAWSMALYELRRLLRARHALARIGVVFTPFLIALVVAAVRIALAKESFSGDLLVNGRPVDAASQERALALFFRIAMLRWLVFLAAAGLFGGLFSGERSERTLHHAFLQPLRREALTVGKFLGGVMLLWPATVLSWVLTTAAWMSPHGLGAVAKSLLAPQGLADMLSYALVLLLAVAAYGGVFLMAGAYVRSPPLVALGLLAWEGLCAFLPVTFQRFTVYYWLDSLLPLRVPAGSALAVLADPAPWPLAVAACLAVGAAGIALAAWRARTMELAYGSTE